MACSKFDFEAKERRGRLFLSSEARSHSRVVRFAEATRRWMGCADDGRVECGGARQCGIFRRCNWFLDFDYLLFKFSVSGGGKRILHKLRLYINFLIMTLRLIFEMRIPVRSWVIGLDPIPLVCFYLCLFANVVSRVVTLCMSRLHLVIRADPELFTHNFQPLFY